MKILVAGGAGFIGSHLCEALLAAGHGVMAVDNLLTGSRDNLVPWGHSPRFQFIEHDLSLPLPPELSADIICHLASPASPASYHRYAVETMLVNSLGTYHLLELARRDQSRFLLASTSEAYGEPLEHPQTETYWGNVNPIGPRSCYDEGKRFAEALTITYYRRYALDGRIMRIFNCYGPRSDPEDGRMVPNFITQALRGVPITVYGDGQQTRSLCYVSDMVRGIMALALAQGLAGEVFNLGSPEEHPVLRYAEMIKELAGSSSSIVHTPPREEEVSRRRPDIRKARERLGWEPRVSLKEGLRLTIQWFRSRLTSEAPKPGAG